jgi:hypothetical protein
MHRESARLATVSRPPHTVMQQAVVPLSASSIALSARSDSLASRKAERSAAASVPPSSSLAERIAERIAVVQARPQQLQ